MTTLFLIADAAGAVCHGPAAWSAYDFGRRMQELLDAHNAALPEEPPLSEPWAPPEPPDPLPEDWVPPEPPEPEPWAPSTRVGNVALGAAPPAEVLAWEGCPYRILPCAVLGPYDPATQVLGAPAVDADVAAVAAVDRPLAEVQALRVGEAKAEAGRRILERYPTWKQNNMNMQATRLHNVLLRGGAWTAVQAGEAAALEQAGDWIISVRAASNAIEAWIADPSRTVADLRSMAGAPGWPE